MNPINDQNNNEQKLPGYTGSIEPLQGVPEAMSGIPQQVTPSQTETPPAKPKKNMNMVIMFSVLAIIFLIIIACYFFFFSSAKTQIQQIQKQTPTQAAQVIQPTVVPSKELSPQQQIESIDTNASNASDLEQTQKDINSL
jgi:flagellar biosynthesis/type III secretory pathway M-ring protein FliF/YscJ